MSGSVNKVTLLGVLGRDPDIRSMQNGNRVCNLSVATSETWRDRQSGERREKTEWHRVTIWNDGLVGVAEKYLRKGSKVYLEGQLQTRKWQDQSGQDRYSTEVVLQNFGGQMVLLGDPKGGQREEPQGEPDALDIPAHLRGGQQGRPGTDEQLHAQDPNRPVDDLDDSIPF